jgi:hypothetical protein
MELSGFVLEDFINNEGKHSKGWVLSPDNQLIEVDQEEEEEDSPSDVSDDLDIGGDVNMYKHAAVPIAPRIVPLPSNNPIEVVSRTTFASLFSQPRSQSFVEEEKEVEASQQGSKVVKKDTVVGAVDGKQSISPATTPNPSEDGQSRNRRISSVSFENIFETFRQGLLGDSSQDGSWSSWFGSGDGGGSSSGGGSSGGGGGSSGEVGGNMRRRSSSGSFFPALFNTFMWSEEQKGGGSVLPVVREHDSEAELKEEDDQEVDEEEDQKEKEENDEESNRKDDKGGDCFEMEEQSFHHRSHSLDRPPPPPRISVSKPLGTSLDDVTVTPSISNQSSQSERSYYLDTLSPVNKNKNTREIEL